MKSIKLRYGLPLFMLWYAAHFAGNAQNAIARDAAQGRDAFQSEADDLKRQLNQMEEALLAQRKMVKQMEALALSQQAQIEELRNRIETVSAKPVVMAKEEIQDEVKQEVGSYLASDEARERLGLSLPGQYEPVNGYYLPDKEKATIGFRTKDGNYSFNLGFRFQSRFTYRDNSEDHGETDKTDIDVRRARLCFGGNVYSKDINYYVEIDGDSFEVNTRDYYVWWSPLDEFNVKTGYFKVPANRQWNSSGFKLLLQDRSIAGDAFKQDRDYGLDVFGRPFDGHAEYHAAIFRGAGQNPAKTLGKDENIDNELLGVLTARYYPLGWYDSYNIVSGWDETSLKREEGFKAIIGASVVNNAKIGDIKLADTDSIIGSVDIGVRYKRFTWDSEYYLREIDPEGGGDSTTSDGFYTQAGYFVLPQKLELAARYSALDPNNDLPDDFQKEYTVGINYYFRGHRSKIQADMSHFVTDTTDTDKDENRCRLQYQLIF